MRKKLQSSGKKAMDFQWMNRRKKKLRMTAKNDGTYFDIYKDADKGTASNVVLNDERFWKCRNS